jgi:16S rRNA (guanine527-N7)-methyltransferase
VTTSEFGDRLSARSARVGVVIGAEARDQLEAYFRLLAQWNATINLTALPLKRVTDETVDRLFIEPLVAACYVKTPANWYDLGSGGGSPAIPFKIMHPRAKLTMVESKSRKVAFLREAVRTIGLSDAIVENDRFERLAATPRHRGKADLVTVRAVKGNRALFSALEGLLGASGLGLVFHSAAPIVIPTSFQTVQTLELRTIGDAQLSILKPMFHVKQSN